MKKSFSFKKFFFRCIVAAFVLCLIGYFARNESIVQKVVIFLEKLVPSKPVATANGKPTTPVGTANIKQEPTTKCGVGDDPVATAVLAAQGEGMSKEFMEERAKARADKREAVVYSFSEKADFIKAFSGDYTKAAFGLGELKGWSKATTLVVATDVAYSFLKRNPQTPWDSLSPWNGKMKKLISREMFNRKANTPKVSSPAQTIRGQASTQEEKKKKDPDLKNGLIIVSQKVGEILFDLPITKKGEVKKGDFFSTKIAINSVAPNEVANFLAIFEKKGEYYQLREGYGWTTKTKN